MAIEDEEKKLYVSFRVTPQEYEVLTMIEKLENRVVSLEDTLNEISKQHNTDVM